MLIIKVAVVGLLVAASATLHADFTYTETTQITGGSMLGIMKMASAFSKEARKAGEPIVSTVAIKGNRMAHINPDHNEIIDLDAETITNIDTLKRQYTVVTFEQMKQHIEAAAARMKAQQQKAETTTPEKPATTDVKFEVHGEEHGSDEGRVGSEYQRIDPYDEHGRNRQELWADGNDGDYERYVASA